MIAYFLGRLILEAHSRLIKKSCSCPYALKSSKKFMYVCNKCARIFLLPNFIHHVSANSLYEDCNLLISKPINLSSYCNQSFVRELQSISFRKITFTQLLGDVRKHISNISQILSKNTMINEICIQSSSLTSAIILQIMSVLHFVSKVNFRRNNINATGIEALVIKLKANKFITHIDISNNPIGLSGVKSISDHLAGQSNLLSLTMEGTNIRYSEAAALSKALKLNSVINVLNIAHNSI